MKPREAATVMLVRDDLELEVFMSRRNLEADFMGGAYVFPGGAVDVDDRAPELLARCQGPDDAVASAALGLPAGGVGFWVAAVREAFEEAGVLLARSAAIGLPVDLDDAALATSIEAARRAVGSGEYPFLDVVRDEDLLLDTGARREGDASRNRPARVLVDERVTVPTTPSGRRRWSSNVGTPDPGSAP